ncbi:MAG: FHA domain-containing protein [Gemmataceae bacterium]|nr:FHA domain-containing protein [Gemmataceae bacterium]
MAHLLLLSGPDAGTRFPLRDRQVTIGRHATAHIHLDLPDVSRRHAQITHEGDTFYLEDLGSSYGTYLNGLPLKGKAELHEHHRILIGSCEFLFEDPDRLESGVIIRSELSLHPSNSDLYRLDSATKLQAVLDIAHHLAQTLDLDVLLPRLLDHLLALFLKADRGLVLLREGDRMEVRAVRVRRPDRAPNQVYSRSVVQRVLAEGVGVVAADHCETVPAQTLMAAGVRSFVCVPLKSRDDRPLGVLQLDRSGQGADFTHEDLHLLTAISLQVSAVLDNAALHATLLDHERVKRDLALARLGQMAAGVAHEINNPLAFVNSNTAVVQRDVGMLRQLLDLYAQAEAVLSDHAAETLAKIHDFAAEIDLPYTLENLDGLLTRSREGLKRIQQIVQGLREFARLDESELDEVDLNAGVESALSVTRGLAAKRKVELALDLEPLPPVTCRPARINQVVFNLVANAIDACAEGGQVTVRTRAADGAVAIHVIDNGCGIPPSIRDRIFDPFFTTKPLGKGVGLGLSISHGIVQDHGGTIEVESQPGQGAQFTVRLPLQGAPPVT